MDKHPGETLLEHFETFTDVVVEILTMGSTPLSSASTRKLLTAHRGVKASIVELAAMKSGYDDDDELNPADAELAGSMGAALSGGAPQPEPRAGRGKGKGKSATRVEDPPPPPPPPTADDPPPPADDPPPPADDPPPPPPPSEDPPPPPAADPA